MSKKIFQPMLLSMLVIIVAAYAAMWLLITSLGKPGTIVYGIFSYLALVILVSVVTFSGRIYGGHS